MRLSGLRFFQNTSRLRIPISDARLQALDRRTIIRVPFSQNLVEALARLDGILIFLLDYRLEPLHFVRLAG